MIFILYHGREALFISCHFQSGLPVQSPLRALAAEVYFAKELIQLLNRSIDYSKLKLKPAGLTDRLIREGGSWSRR